MIRCNRTIMVSRLVLLSCLELLFLMAIQTKVIVNETDVTAQFAGPTNQSMLLEDLFQNYYPGVIPKCEGVDGPVQVKIGISIRQILDLNEPQQILNVNLWIRSSWTDCQLVWDPEDYGGIESLTVPHGKIWVPDITLYDNNQEGEMPGLSDHRPTILSDGVVLYNYPTILYSLCKIDSTYFPFDSQMCPLKFGSWSYDGFLVDITNTATTAELTQYKNNTEWHLVSALAERHEVYYPCCDAPYPDVTFYVNLERKPINHVVNMLFPTFLMSCIALLGFILPADAGEKIGLEITALLALAFYAMLVSRALPPSETVPYVGLYFALTLFMVSISLTMSVFILNLHHKGQLGRPVPNIFRKLVLNGLGRFLLIKPDGEMQVPEPDTPELYRFVNNRFSLDKSNQNIKSSKALNFEVPDKTNPSIEMRTTAVTKILSAQLDIFKRLENKRNKQQKDDDVNSEWQRVAVVMDRFFFVLFALFSGVTTVTLLILIML